MTLALKVGREALAASLRVFCDHCEQEIERGTRAHLLAEENEDGSPEPAYAVHVECTELFMLARERRMVFVEFDELVAVVRGDVTRYRRN